MFINRMNSCYRSRQNLINHDIILVEGFIITAYFLFAYKSLLNHCGIIKFRL